MLLEDFPGLGQDARRALVRAGARAAVHPRAVHARPAAGRPHRLLHLRPEAGRVRLPAGAAVHRPAARRRDQPDAAEDPVRAAGGDAGAAGHGRGADPPPRRALPRAGDRQPGRVRGHLPAAGGPARPVPAAGRLRLPVGRRGVGRRTPPARPPPGGDPARPGDRRARAARDAGRPGDRGGRPQRGRLLRAAGRGDAQPRRRADRLVAARVAGPGADRAGARRDPGPRLRGPRGRQGGGRRRSSGTGSRSSRSSG